MLWGKPGRALLQQGRQTAPDPFQEEPQGRVLPSSLSSVWLGTISKNRTACQPGEAEFGRSSAEPVATSCAGEGGKRKSLGGGATRHPPAALSKTSPSRTWLRGSRGARAGHLGRPCLPERSSHREPSSLRVWPTEKASAASHILGPRQGPDESF